MRQQPSLPLFLRDRLFGRGTGVSRRLQAPAGSTNPVSGAELGAPRLSAAGARLQSQQRTAVARLTKTAGQEIPFSLSARWAEDGLPSKPVQVARRAQAANELCPTGLVAMQATRHFRPMSARALGPMVITALTHLPQNAGHARFSAYRTREQALALAGMTSAAQVTQDQGEPRLPTAWTAEHTLRQTLSACAAQSLAHHGFLCLCAGWAGKQVFLIGHRPEEEESDEPPAVTLRLEVHS